jgi:hypothetical protein
MKKILSLLYVFCVVPAFSFYKDEFESDTSIKDTIAYHIYLVEMNSMPKESEHSHYCRVKGAQSRFGVTSREAALSNDDHRIANSKKLASLISQISETFSFSSKFQIGYWLGILHLESRFCEGICGGSNCSNLNAHIDSMSGTVPPYADLGIGQINFLTFKDFMERLFYKYEDHFQDLINKGIYKERFSKLTSVAILKSYLESLIPSSKKTISKNKEDIKALYGLLRNDDALNLSFSLPILLEKIKEGINIDDINDPSSRVQDYQRSKALRKFSKPFISGFNSITSANKLVWQRSFGVLTYNGHKRYALDYAIDVYCIKSLYDGNLLRPKDTLETYIFKNKEAPFHLFSPNGYPFNLTNCEEIIKLRDEGEMKVLGKKQMLLSVDYFKGIQGSASTTRPAPVPSEPPPIDGDDDLNGTITVNPTGLLKLGNDFYQQKGLKRINILLETQKTPYGSFSNAVEQIGYKGSLYLYGFLKNIAFPNNNYGFSHPQYEDLVQIVRQLNPELQSNILNIKTNLLVPVITKEKVQTQASKDLPLVDIEDEDETNDYADQATVKENGITVFQKLSFIEKNKLKKRGAFSCQDEGMEISKYCYLTNEKEETLIKSYGKKLFLYKIPSAKMFRVYSI